MNDKEKVNLVAEEVQKKYGLRNNIDYHIGKIVKGDKGTYITLNDNENDKTLYGIGLWIVLDNGTPYCVNIPVDDEYWEDYDNHSDDEDNEEDIAMEKFGL